MSGNKKEMQLVGPVKKAAAAKGAKKPAKAGAKKPAKKTAAKSKKS